MKKLITTLILFLTFAISYSQPVVDVYNVVMKWPPERMFIRIFKHEMELEVWVSDSVDFYLYKRYNICKLSGDFGPKRKQGDLQVPEGFYFINDFNPFSKYHLSMGINYPNQSDKILSPYKNMGGLIYIHGDCVSVGCIAMGNKNVEEIYKIARKIKTPIEVHIFPVNYLYLKSLNWFDKKIKQNPELIDFEKNLFEGYLYFQESNRLPNVIFLENGFYRFE